MMKKLLFILVGLGVIGLGFCIISSITIVMGMLTFTTILGFPIIIKVIMTSPFLITARP